jgi:hypothetical protein
MYISKPYGRSHVEEQRPGETRRVLRLRSDPEKPLDIEQFARSHDRLVIAQWISAIDKIASKPAGTNGATNEQRALRERLGKAALELIEARGLVPGLREPVTREHLTKLWRVKIAPYGAARYKAQTDKHGKELPSPSPKGRWYDRFTGGVPVHNVDAVKVVAKIYEHLHAAEYRIATDSPNRKQGRIVARARSIVINVPRRGLPAYSGSMEVDWTSDDRKTYARAGDVANEIRLAAQRREKGEDKAGIRRVTLGIAAAALFKHYARLFHENDGKVLTIRDARDRFPQLFGLHMAVKDCYSRVLKHHKKDQRVHGDARRKVSDLLPKTMDDLFVLVDRMGANHDLNALVRLGKIIHYESSGSAEDKPANVVQDWPADVTRSYFWTSEGQAKIKRNEAFVRAWRYTLALASRTLTDWADPKGKNSGDILLAEPIRRATGEQFDSDSYVRKLDLLYGNRAVIFKSTLDGAFQRNTLRLALEGVAALRHGSFHFQGLGGFADALTASTPTMDLKILQAIQELWQTDVKARAHHTLKTMHGAHFAYFLNETQNHSLFAALSNPDTALIPLPRFRRILQRAQNAWQGKDSLRLPEPANRTDLENPARLCQYAALKLLYERAFRTWLRECKTTILNCFIDRAVQRATAAARDLNAGNDGDLREVIVARAAALGRLADGDDVQAFFFNLSAETATEMRVGRSYDSDPDRAREHAGYIENLKCDVVALAFRDYLSETHFDFLLNISPTTTKPETALCDLSRVPVHEVDTRAETWQALLYFLIHLVPVDEIGKLLHQMRKWEILAGKPAIANSAERRSAEQRMSSKVRQVQLVLELYLDMHDAKFEGGAALIGTKAFIEFFDSEELFDQIFPTQYGDNDDRRVPRRGLREIMRFGHLPVLAPVFKSHAVKRADVSEFFQAEQLRDGKPDIVYHQEHRESFHEKWTREKRKFSTDDLQAYVDALSRIVRHRHLAAHVSLTNHVRLHRLLMTVLGRLVDYSGLWERDLYFATLALIGETGCRPEEVFTDDGLHRLSEGRIVDALRQLQQTSEACEVAAKLSRYFGRAWERGNRATQIRNDFAHFNMLNSEGLPIDLTACVNNARELMAYDRKLRNAVSRSIKEILYREGLLLEWVIKATSGHRLGRANVQTRQALHLGGMRLRETGGPDEHRARPLKGRPILENLHGDHFVAMVAALFGEDRNGEGKFRQRRPT